MEARCLIGVFRQISKDLDKELKVKLKERRVPILVAHITLFYILPQDGETLAFNLLLKKWHISKSSLSDILKRYEQEKLIYRKDSHVDKRVVEFGLSSRGLKVIEDLIHIEDELLEDLMINLKENEKVYIERMLRKIVKKEKRECQK